MKATFKDARLFRNLIGAVSDLIEEADMTASAEGLKLQAMDPAHVAMVDFECTKKMFETYECTIGNKFRINLVKLSQLLARANPGDTLDMSYDLDTKKFKFVLKGTSTKRFSVGTMEPKNEKVPSPNVVPTAKVMITSKSFKELLEDSNAVGEHVLLTAEAGKFMAQAVGDTSKVEVEKLLGVEVMDINVANPVSAKYNLEMLSKIAGAGASVSDLSTLEFSEAKPIKVSFTVPEGKLDYYLAPRVPQTGDNE
jgi:proliferating cell nuclear antigen